jgi:galactose-1-phosphate uridylyltransferase
MPELRQNFFTKEWVIIATERARRPEELATRRPVQAIPAFAETCPFCPGNESGGPWAVTGHPQQVRRAVERCAADAQSAALAAMH